jgi:competence protein ComEA
MIEWFRLNLRSQARRKSLPAAVFVAALTVPALPAQGLPDGPGKSSLEKVCTKCHDLNQVTARRRTATDWDMTVDKMITQGAQGTDDQFGEILDYLIRNFRKPINVNQASAKSLEDELELSTKEAEAIVAYREKNAPFQSLDDLKKVPGLDPKKVDAAKDWVAF